MNVDLFVKSLNPNEKKEILNKLLIWERHVSGNIDNRLTKDFIKNNEMRSSMRNALELMQDDFPYIRQWNKKDFMRVRNLGKKSWDEFVELRGY